MLRFKDENAEHSCQSASLTGLTGHHPSGAASPVSAAYAQWIRIDVT